MPRPGRFGGLRLLYLAEYENLVLGVPVEGVRVVDEVPEQLAILRRGHDKDLLGPVVEDQLVGKFALLQRSLVAPVGVDVGHLPNHYSLLGVLLRHGSYLLFASSPDEPLLPTRTPHKPTRRKGYGGGQGNGGEGQHRADNRRGCIDSRRF